MHLGENDGQHRHGHKSRLAGTRICMGVPSPKLRGKARPQRDRRETDLRAPVGETEEGAADRRTERPSFLVSKSALVDTGDWEGLETTFVGQNCRPQT